MRPLHICLALGWRSNLEVVGGRRLPMQATLWTRPHRGLPMALGHEKAVASFIESLRTNTARDHDGGCACPATAFGHGGIHRSKT